MSDADYIDHYGDGRWYDAEYVHMRGDIDYYVGIAANSPGPLLELAAGTGRLTIPMVQAGAEVVGVDSAIAMVEEAERKRAALPFGDRARLTFVRGDMRSLRLDRKFSRVVLAFNTLMHMTEDADLAATLATVRAHLTDDGLFSFDLHTPYPSLPKRDPEGRYDPQQMFDPRTGARILVTENSDYDPRTQINTMRFFYQEVTKDDRPVGRERFTELRLRVIFPRELDHYLDVAGFEIVGDFDDFAETQPFSGRGGRRVVHARLKSPAARARVLPHPEMESR